MSLQLRDIRLALHEEEASLREKVARHLGVPVERITSLRILRKGIDARKKPKILRVYTLLLELENEAELLENYAGRDLSLYEPVPLPEIVPTVRTSPTLVVGMGPAGLFCAWQLARHGFPVTLIERGQPVEQRVKDVAAFWQRGVFQGESNVQFGEGGAGTFSDGKLTTRLKHPEIALILRTLVRFGAPEEILWSAKPHVGTDVLRTVLQNFRKELQSLGVQIRFGTRFVEPVFKDGALRGGRFHTGEELGAEQLVIAPGHSARDTYRQLHRAGLAMESKPFAVGVRVEHPVELINRIQYGFDEHPRLGAADYSLAWNDPSTKRGTYSFCMCPGGEVVNASSEEGRLVVNGMSLSRRGSRFSNSALVVAVRREDFPGDGPLSGVRFQEQLEEAAYVAGGSDWRAPAQNLLHFLGGNSASVRATCRPGVREARLDTLLPPVVVDGLRRALPQFDRRMRGFVSAEGVLVGVETRTSAPLRILRGEDGQSVSHPGIYPTGEGAGYAGGIMSAALDGLRTARNILAPQEIRREF